MLVCTEFADPSWLFLIWASVLGMVLGSFYFVCAVRWITGESIFFPPSHCPICGNRLHPLELIPILSWLWQRGRCTHCGKPISCLYPCAEILSGLVAFLLALRYGWSGSFVYCLIFCGLLQILSFIDVKTMLLPDLFVLFPIPFVLIMTIFGRGLDWTESFLGMLFGYTLFFLLQRGYRLVRDREGLGSGDVKLMALLGGFCGWRSLPIVLLVASISALIFFLLFIVVKHRRKSQISLEITKIPVPFGPFLSLGAFISLLF